MVIMSDIGAFSLKLTGVLLSVACVALMSLWLAAENRPPEYIELPQETVTVTDTLVIRDTVTVWRTARAAQTDTSAQEGQAQ